MMYFMTAPRQVEERVELESAGAEACYLEDDIEWKTGKTSSALVEVGV
jgi:hypothetical protein